ncbi:hypothetical protein Bpfe_031054 [Biomphalaria pfeifferi]|uniref:Uncharacterized protein n=1 Tax=Biomphalaria pfeifferi TaxID=112525 RepID=A0AAD8AQ72_BIOPF|nr:hypothetical protein Bpfe_031054 [Biomphalaria pfeifferi]
MNLKGQINSINEWQTSLSYLPYLQKSTLQSFHAHIATRRCDSTATPEIHRRQRRKCQAVFLSAGDQQTTSLLPSPRSRIANWRRQNERKYGTTAGALLLFYGTNVCACVCWCGVCPRLWKIVFCIYRLYILCAYMCLPVVMKPMQWRNKVPSGPGSYPPPALRNNKVDSDKKEFGSSCV